MTRLKALWVTLVARYRTLPRAFQLVVMAVGAAAAVMIVYAPIARFNAYRAEVQQEIETSREEVEHLSSYVARAEQVRREGELLEKRLDGLKTRLVPGNTGPLAAAQLQDKVTTIANETAVSIQSTQVMREEAVGRYVQVTVRLTARATLRALAAFLEKVEYGETQLGIPFLQVDRRGAVVRRPAAAAAGATDDERILSATVEVRGLAALAEAEQEQETGERSEAAAES
jgi:hypothetical protein